jgi:hypothetical protein
MDIPENLDPFGSPADIIKLIESCPESQRGTWVHGYLCGLAEGRIAGQLCAGERTDVPDLELFILHRALAAHAEP